MTRPDDQLDPEFDARLRDVVVPDGLLASLSKLARETDELGQSDEPSMVDEAQRTAQSADDQSGPVDDQHVEERLREVPLPPRVPKRLRHIARTSGELLRAERLPDELPFEAEIDRCLRAVTVPPQLEARLGRIPLESARWRRRLWQAAVAAALLISVGWALSGPVWQIARPDTDHLSDEADSIQIGEVIADDGSSSTDDALVTIEPAGAGNASTPVGAGELTVPMPVAVPDEPLTTREPLLAGRDEPTSDSSTSATDSLLTGDDPARRAALVSDVAETPWGVFAANAAFDELPDLHKARPLVPRGFEPPVDDAWDTFFVRQFRVHPFVAAAALPEIAPPLARGVTSYELWNQYLEGGESPPADAVRTEDFLAALDYKFAPPTTQAVGIRTALGPCPWGAPGRYLLLVGLQTAEPSRSVGVATHLTIAADVSASMQRSGRLEIAKRAIVRLLDDLGPHDRVSLVTFGSRARVVIEEAGMDDRAALVEALAALEPESSTNLGAGLQLAYAVAEAAPAAGPDPATRLRRRVALVTDGLTDLDPLTAGQIETGLAKSRAQGIELDVIDASGEPQGEATLKMVAGWAERPLRQVASTLELARALREALWDQPQLVARGARLSVRFDPATVERYRLVGHEATDVAGLLPAAPTIDLYARDMAVVLFELELEPTGVASELAHARVAWQNPADGNVEQVDQPISRRQIAATFRESSLALQGASVAALAGELLRGSPFVQESGWGQARQLADGVHAQLAAQPDFARLARQIERTAEARGARSRPRGR
ncbi:MAG: VWA domain-containing protein [Pirellulales bacterium]|nr:VWA domain-containing protein [Pirellulales bacterium]